MGTQLPKFGTAPQFWALVCCDQRDGWVKMPPGTEIGLGIGHVVLDGVPSHPPQFSAHVNCGQTAVWIKVALVTEVGLGPSRDIVHN